MTTSCVSASQRRRLCKTGISLMNNLTDDLLVDILLRFPPKCKSVSKRWHSLISAPCFARSSIRLSSETPINNFMLLFKIIRGLAGIGQVYVLPLDCPDEADVFIIHVFSTADETPGWAIFRPPCPPHGGWSTTTDPIEVVFYNGKFHWDGYNGIAVYDPFNNPRECDIIPFPPINSLEPAFKYYSFSLEACQGRLRLVTSCEETPRLLVWELVDYDTKSWVKLIYVDITVYDDIDDDSRLTYGGAVGDKIYMLNFPSTIKVFDVRNASLQHVYTYPAPLSSFLKFIKPFLSSPWPTPLPMRHRK